MTNLQLEVWLILDFDIWCCYRSDDGDGSKDRGGVRTTGGTPWPGQSAPELGLP